MMRHGKMLFSAAAIIALGMFHSEARAAFLVQVTATLNGPNPDSVTSVIGQSTVTLATYKGAPSDIDLGGTISPIHVTFGTTSTTSSNTSSVDAVNLNYGWTLTLAHILDGEPVGGMATVNVSGQIVGNLTARGSTLDNIYTGGPINAATVVKVDGVSVSVRLDDWTPPGTPPSFRRNFSVSLIDPIDPAIFTVPEPTTMALMGLGGLLLIAPRIRRRKATADLG